MHIVHGPRLADNFTILSNAILRDATLSFAARGVLAMLLSYSDGIHLTAENIAARSDHDGRRAVLSALKELRAAGFLHLHKWQDEGGHWRTLNVLYEEPRTPDQAAQDREKLSTGTGVRLRNVGGPNVGARHAVVSTRGEGLKEGERAARPAPPPVDNSTAPPPCRRHPNGWHHDDPCRACQALRQHDQSRPAHQPAPKPPHCGHCDIVDRTISHADAFGHLVLTPCPRCSPRRMALTQPS